MPATVKVLSLPNGLTVLLESLPHLHSFSYSMLLPGGLIADPEDAQGASLILAELLSRGAAGKDSRELSDLFESAGISHSEAVNEDYFSLSGSCLSAQSHTALQLLSDLICRPTLPESEIDPIRSVLVQEILGLADNPARRAFQEFDKVYYPKPVNRSEYGTQEGLMATNSSTIKHLWESCFKPQGAVLSIAGKFELNVIEQQVQQIFGSWQGSGFNKAAVNKFPSRLYKHIDEKSAQLQIVMGYPSAAFGTEKYYVAKVATEILAGGFCGRLFTEVREKRGLCYSVHASHSSTPEYGVITAYAGTTTERAQETLDVMLSVLTGLVGSVALDELARAKANLLTGLIISQEPARARAGGNAIDFAYGRKVRSLDDIKSAILSVTAEEIDAYVAEFSPDKFSLLTLGAKRLDLNRDFEGAVV
jgi:predicted Zn-dependent peptidase